MIVCGQTNQILIASNMVGVVEGLLYAQRAGLDLEQVIAAVGAGAAGTPHTDTCTHTHMHDGMGPA